MVVENRDFDQVIHMLSDHYPACFFRETKLRLPLKQNITADIVKDDNFQVAPALLASAVDWYRSHIDYIRATIAGSKRIDLEGREVGTVTEPEARAAQQELNEIYRRRKPKETEMNSSRLDDYTAVRKMVDPPAASPRSKAPAMAAEFAELYEKLTAANAAVAVITDPAMRTAVAKTLLDMVITKAQQVRSELEANQ